MDTPELLCDLKMIKADYCLIDQESRNSDHCFRITVLPHERKLHFDIAEGDGQLFADELDTLAAIIRARAVQARLGTNA